MESFYTLIIFLILFCVFAVPYWIRVVRHRREAEEKLNKSIEAGILTPVTLHPHINLQECIGCGSCIKVCPESALGIVNGRAAVVSGLKCIGHSLCADVCPVGAITMGFGTPKQGQEIPWYDENFQTNVPGLYIVGELSGIGLIKNAVTQATKAINHITQKNIADNKFDFDVVIIGAGPAGLTAALASQEQKLRYIVLEQDSIGGTIFHYPRQKLVLTSPVELPLYGKLKVSEITKEELLKMWMNAIESQKVRIQINTKVVSIIQNQNGFRISYGDSFYSAKNVVLALGRRGSPRKLGIPGEDLPKVAYQLIEAELYTQKNILIVGGGDSAVEAAVALARQKGNTVTLSYRRSEFIRLKEKNKKNVENLIQTKKIKVFFNSQLLEIHKESVLIKEEPERRSTISNDYIFIFAGGDMPIELLKQAGVRFRTQEIVLSIP